MKSFQNFQIQFKEEFTKYSNCQKEYQKVLKDRELSESQLNENKAVYEEFKLLQEDCKIYKLVGPALLKQDLQEAIKNVEDRINFIKIKLKTLNNSAEDLEVRRNKHREKLNKLEFQFKQAQSEASK